MKRHSVLVATGVVALAALLPPAEATPAPPSAVTVMVRDQALAFDARTVVLQLDRNGTATVTWRWETTSTRPHNVEADDGTFNSHPGCSGGGYYGFDPGVASCGLTGLTTYRQTFRRAGVYRYHCAVHGGPENGMAGTVVVKAPPGKRSKRGR